MLPLCCCHPPLQMVSTHVRQHSHTRNHAHTRNHKYTRARQQLTQNTRYPPPPLSLSLSLPLSIPFSLTQHPPHSSLSLPLSHSRSLPYTHDPPHSHYCDYSRRWGERVTLKTVVIPLLRTVHVIKCSSMHQTSTLQTSSHQMSTEKS